jgi:hypothetical protein
LTHLEPPKTLNFKLIYRNRSRNRDRHSMLDALGGTLDSDRDIDQPADLGVWWSDSLPTRRMASSLSDSDSF